MRYMYYCSICNFLGSDEGEYSGAVCPKCGRPLYATKVSKEEWSRKRESDKRLLKSKWLQNIMVTKYSRRVRKIRICSFGF